MKVKYKQLSLRKQEIQTNNSRFIYKISHVTMNQLQIPKIQTKIQVLMKNLFFLIGSQELMILTKINSYLTRH